MVEARGPSRRKPRRTFDPAAYLEERVEVWQTHTVLLRFPCFDFFRNVHLCERQEQEQQQDRSIANSSCSTNAVTFCPESVRVVPGTLQTAHPIVVVNAATPQEMVFVGSWEEVLSARSHPPLGARTNRAIVHLASQDDADARGGVPDIVPSRSAWPTNDMDSAGSVSQADSRGEGRAEGVAEVAKRTADHVNAARDPVGETSGTGVASLLPHVEGGVTADDMRVRKARRLDKGWRYDSIDVPTAVLVLHRYR